MTLSSAMAQDEDGGDYANVTNGTVTTSWKHHPPPPDVDSLLKEVYDLEKSLLENNNGDDNVCPPSARSNMSNLNHGGFGDPYPSTLKLRQFLTDLCYRNPSVYHRSIVPALATRAKKAACDYLSIQENQRDGFAFCSISSALFHVLQAIKFDEGDVIVSTDTIYHSLKDTIWHLAKVHKLKWVQVETPHGADSEAMYSEFERVIREQVEEKQTVKLAVFDHISSKPTVMYPVKKMCQLCHSLSIPTLVDGAHVPGSMPSRFINVPNTMATFYCVTFHKWCNTPRGGGSGGIWVNKTDIVEKSYTSFIDISRLVVNGGWSDNVENDDDDMYLDASQPGYLTDSLTQGIYDESTREYENILVLPHCLNLVLRHEEAFQKRIARLREESIKILSNAWDLTEQEANKWGGVYAPLDKEGIDDEIALAMLSIPLPTQKLLGSTVQFSPAEGLTLHQKLKLLKKCLVPRLWKEYGVEVPIFIWKDKLLGVRISFGRHVTTQDIERLGDAINQVVEKGYIRST